MFDVPPEFWEYLSRSSDALGLATFLNGLVRFVGEKKAANETVVIEDYLEQVRRGEHREICELVLNNARALESLRAFAAQIVAQSTDRILAELRKELGEFRRLLEVPETPVITARVSRALGPQVNRGPAGDRSFQIGFVIRNHSNCPANVARAWSFLTIQGQPVRCGDGDIAGGCRLAPHDTRGMHAHTGVDRWPEGDPVLVCLVLEVEQDEGKRRCLLPRLKDRQISLIDHKQDLSAGQKWMMKPRDGRGVGPVTLIHPTGDLKGWFARDKDGEEFELSSNWLLESGMVPLAE